MIQKSMILIVAALGLLIALLSFPDKNSVMATSASSSSAAQIPTEPQFSQSELAKISQLSAEYLKMKQTPSHFTSVDGDKYGEWDDKLDGNDSEKSKIVGELGALLGRAGVRYSTIKEYMGEFDTISYGKDSPFQSPPFVPADQYTSDGVAVKDGYYMVYFIRGPLEYLQFLVQPLEGENAVVFEHSIGRTEVTH